MHLPESLQTRVDQGSLKMGVAEELARLKAGMSSTTLRTDRKKGLLHACSRFLKRFLWEKEIRTKADGLSDKIPIT